MDIIDFGNTENAENDSKEETTMRLLPKGLILLALGGYCGDERTHKDTAAVVDKLKTFLNNNHFCIYYNEKLDGLDFAEFKILSDK